MNMREGEIVFFFFSSRRRHTRSKRDWSSDVCSSDLIDIRSGLSSGMAGSAVREDPADSVDELERPERLGEVLGRADREPGLLVALALVRRQHHDGDVLGARLGLELTADVEAIRPGSHVDV